MSSERMVSTTIVADHDVFDSLLLIIVESSFRSGNRNALYFVIIAIFSTSKLQTFLMCEP